MCVGQRLMSGGVLSYFSILFIYLKYFIYYYCVCVSASEHAVAWVWRSEGRLGCWFSPSILVRRECLLSIFVLLCVLWADSPVSVSSLTEGVLGLLCETEHLSFCGF